MTQCRRTRWKVTSNLDGSSQHWARHLFSCRTIAIPARLQGPKRIALPQYLKTETPILLAIALLLILPACVMCIPAPFLKHTALNSSYLG